jgi:hypothetical protein
LIRLAPASLIIKILLSQKTVNRNSSDALQNFVDSSFAKSRVRVAQSSDRGVAVSFFNPGHRVRAEILMLVEQSEGSTGLDQ